MTIAIQTASFTGIAAIITGVILIIGYFVQKSRSNNVKTNPNSVFGMYWSELVKNRDIAKRNLDIGMAKADSTKKWAWCAEGNAKLGEDNSNIKACIINAQKYAKDFFDWKQCYISWMSLLDDKENARKCLINAEIEVKKKHGGNEFGWCIEKWVNDFNETDNARKLIAYVEKETKAYVACASFYSDYLKDYKEEKRCLTLAEEN